MAPQITSEKYIVIQDDGATITLEMKGFSMREMIGILEMQKHKILIDLDKREEANKTT